MHILTIKSNSLLSFCFILKQEKVDYADKSRISKKLSSFRKAQNADGQNYGCVWGPGRFSDAPGSREATAAYATEERTCPIGAMDYGSS